MILRHIGAAAVAGGVPRALTVIIPIVIARTYGVGVATDAFFLAASLVLFWTVSIGTVLETAVVTHVVGRGPAGVRSQVLAIGARFSVIAVILGALVLAASAAAPAGLVDPALLATSRRLFWELSPLLVLSVWSSLLSGWLNALRRFVIAAAAPVFIGVAVLASVALAGRELGVHAVVLGYLAGEAARTIFLIVALARGRRESEGASADAPDGKLAAAPFAAMGLQWASLVLVGINPVIDRLLAAGLATGNVSALELIERVALVPGGVMSWAVLPVLTTHWARLADRPASLGRHLRRAIAVVFAAGVAIAALLALAHGPLLPALFGTSRGAWPAGADTAFLWLLAGLPFQLCGLALWRAWVVTRLPARRMLMAGAGAFAINLVGDVIVLGPFGLPGIAAVTSATHLFLCLALWRREDEGMPSWRPKG